MGGSIMLTLKCRARAVHMFGRTPFFLLFLLFLSFFFLILKVRGPELFDRVVARLRITPELNRFVKVGEPVGRKHQGSPATGYGPVGLCMHIAKFDKPKGELID